MSGPPLVSVICTKRERLEGDGEGKMEKRGGELIELERVEIGRGN